MPFFQGPLLGISLPKTLRFCAASCPVLGCSLRQAREARQGGIISNEIRLINEKVKYLDIYLYIVITAYYTRSYQKEM